MYQPRPDQGQALRAVAKARRAGLDRALIVMASGLGKTVVAGFDVRRFLRAHQGAKVLYLCHQNDILRQAREEFEKNILPKRYSHGFLIGSEADVHGVTVLYASFQTMHRHRTMFRRTEFDYIVVDESHHGPAATYLPTLEYFRPKFMLALTATPDRMDQQDISKIYGPPVYTCELEEAWARGLLTPVDYRVVTDEWQNLKILDTPAGRLSITQLNKTIFATKRDEEIVRIIEDKIFSLSDPRVVIFSPRISHAEHLAELMGDAVPIHTELSQREQQMRLTAFRNGETRKVITVDKFNEGIDVPEANVIVFLRSTASRTIFFQQLGRGLRLSPDKKQVLVLDFVANCDRLVTLDRLRRSVQGQLTRLQSLNVNHPVSVDVGAFEFDEVTRSVLEVIDTIRYGYTKGQLVAQLQDAALRLGRSPRIKELDSLGCASVYTLRRAFGSYARALDAAGLRVYRRLGSDQEFLDGLRRLVEELGRAPRFHEINASRHTPRGDTYSQRFGSIDNALRLIGYPTRKRTWTDEELISGLQWLAAKLGRTPEGAEVDAAPELASYGLYTRRFKNYNSALRLAGLAPNVARRTDDELIADLKALRDRLGRPIIRADVDAATGMAGSRVYADRLGWAESLRLIGQDGVRGRRSDEQMLADLRSLAIALGRPLLAEDVTTHPDMAGSGTYAARFGSWQLALRAAGL